MKKVLSLALILLLAFGLAACGEKTPEPAGTPEPAAELTTITVGASATPHAELLELVVDDMKALGYALVVQIFDDYVLPNTGVEEGQLDANYFQHLPYLEDFNAENGTHLVAVAGIHYEPYGVYAGKDKAVTIETLPDGAEISLPNDATNEARALLLLESLGLIKLEEGAGLQATILSIVDNPKNITFHEIEAAQLVRSLDDVDLAVINGNYAILGGLNVSDAIAVEDKDSEAADQYANYLVVKEGNENNAAVQALVQCLQSDKVRQYIEDNYNGSVIAKF